MTLPTITPAPPAPDRLTDDPDEFVFNAIAFLNWLAVFAAQLNIYAPALVAVVSGTDFNGTSTTSLTIGTGSKAFTTQTGKLWQIGQFVMAASTVSPANYMYGQVTAYNSVTGALTVNVTVTGGSGTLAAWSIGLAPVLAGYATLVGAETLSNKTFTLGANTFSGTLAQFNAACTDADFASLAGAETLTNKTLPTPAITDPVLTGTARQDVFAITDAAGFAIDPRNGSIQTVTLGANRTPVAANWNEGEEVILLLTAAGFAVTWSTMAITWIGANAPTLLSSGATEVTIKKVGGVLTGTVPIVTAPSGEITYVGGTTANGALSGSTTAPVVSLSGLTGGVGPAAAAGDTVIVGLTAASISSADLNLAMTTAGYTEIADLYANNATFADTNFAVYIKSLTSADASFTLSIPALAAGSYAVAVQVWRNVDQATPLDTATTTATSITSILADPPANTPVSSLAVAVAIGGGGYSGSAQTFSSSLANFIQATGTGTTSKSIIGMGSFKNPLGTYDPPAFGFSTSDSNSYSYAAATLLLRRA